MILRRLELENWRQFDGGLSFTFDEQANLLFGPNEAGKSTLIEALNRALFAAHGSEKREIKAIQPVDTKLGPRVSVEFAHEGTEYRIEKRFLANKRAELLALRNGQWRREAEGDQADLRVRYLLGGLESRKPETTAETRGIAEVLWTLQEEGALPEKQWSEPVLKGLGSLVDLATLTPEDEALVKRVTKLYAEVFTKERGGYVKGSEPDAASKVAEEAQARYQELVWAEQRAEQKSNEITEDETALAAATVRLQEAQAELAEAQRAYDGARETEIEKERRESEAQAARSLANDAAVRLEEVRKLQALEVATAEEVQRLTQDMALERSNISTYRFRREAIRKQRLETLAPEIEGLSRRQKALAAAERKRKLEKEIERLELVVAQRAAASKERAAAAAALRDLHAPTKEEHERFLLLGNELRLAEARFHASAARVRFDISSPVQTDVPRMDDAYLVAGSAVFRLDGIGTITVESGSEGSADAAQEAKRLQAQIEASLTHYGLESPEAMHRLRGEREAAELRLRDAEKTLQTLSRQDGDPEQELSRARQGLVDESLLASEVKDEVAEWGGEQIRRAQEECGHRIASAQREIAALEAEDVRLEGELDRAQGRLNEAERKLGTQTATQAANGKRMTELLRGGSVEDLERARKDAEVRAADLERRLQELLEDYRSKVQEPRERLELASQAVATFTERVRGLQQRVDGGRGELRGMQLEGLAERLEAAEAALRRAERQRDAAIRRASDLKDLYQALSAARQERTERVSQPIADQVRQWLPRLDGRYSNVEMSIGLLPQRVEGAGLRAALDIESLSCGAKEQITLLVRLALAWHLCENERHLVVLDDRLVNADDRRRRAMCGILNQIAQERCQVLLATCHPDGYGSLQGRRIEVQRDGVRV